MPYSSLTGIYKNNSTMKKVIVTLSALLFFTFSLEAQFSVSAQFGFSAYQGDLHCRSDENIKLLDGLGLSFGLGGRYAISDVIGLRAEAALFRLSGSENNFGNDNHANRGWGFKNNFIEVAALIDYEILGRRTYGSSGFFKKNFTPIIFAGLGVNFNNSKVDFQNNSNSKIESDKGKENMVTVALPVGVGVKYYLSEQFSFAAEFGLRLPVSDYYDGVSESVNPDSNDGYAFMGLKAFFNINRN